MLFFAAEDEGKTEAASPKRREEARKKGQVAKSNDLVTAAMLLIFFTMIRGLSSYYYSNLEGSLQFKGIDFAQLIREGSADQLLKVVGNAVFSLIIISLPLWGVLFLVGFLMNALQVGVKFSQEALKPNFGKMNPLKGLKRMFSKEILMEMMKSIAKGVFLGLIIYNTVIKKIDVFALFYDYSMIQIIYHIGDVICEAGIAVGGSFLFLGGIDYMYQRYKFEDSIKMSKQEVKEEYKQAEGDPFMKGKRKQKMREMSMKRMMQSIPNADVIITNPTHFAIAIAYQKGDYNAPVVVAKGVDHMAKKIREKAREENIQIIENRPLARSLYYTTEIDQEIPPELYVAVAEVLSVVYQLEKEQGGQR